MIPRRSGVPSALRALLLALVAVVLPSSAQASLASLGDVKDAIPELSTALPRELPGPCEGEQCGELEAPQPKTRVRGFELDLYCRLGGEDGLSCRPRQVWVERYDGSASERSVFTGHYFDTETNLYYAKARYFDPQLGRFLSQDSYLGELTKPPSLHRYLYANDNPTFYTDPTGHYSWSEFKDDTRNLAYLGLAYNATVAQSMFGGPQASLAAAADIRDSLVSFGKGAGNQAVDLVKGGVSLAVQDQVYKQRLSRGLADLALTGRGTGLRQLADDTVGMGLGAVREAQLGLGLLGHGVLNPGEVLDVAATLGPNATSKIAGRATFDTGMLVAPMARGGQAATVSEAAGGFANITPEAQALADFALGVPEGAYGVGNALPKAIPALAAPAVAPSSGQSRVFYVDPRGNAILGASELPANAVGGKVIVPEGHVFSPRDLPLNFPEQEIIAGPFSAAERDALLSGSPAGFTAHHRGQIPVEFGGVIDELSTSAGRGGNVHLGGSPTRHPSPSIFNRMQGGKALRGAETSASYVEKGQRLVEIRPGVWIDPLGQ